MSRKIIIDPITRISGFLEITANIDKNEVSDVETSGLLYRGFEKILVNRPPLDAVFLTERICGICSAAHSIASSMAIENALNLKIDINDMYIRDIIHGFEFIQNHIRQFYLFTVPSYVRMPHISPLYQNDYEDFRIPDKVERIINDNYIKSIEMGRLAHEGEAELGGKAPHNHGVFPGGVTTLMDSYKISKIKSIIKKLIGFVKYNMMEDMNIISEYYSDYFKKGKSYNNFLSFGVFNNYTEENISYINPSVIIDGVHRKFSRDKISEDIRYSYYEDDKINLDKENAYTFIKAARYDGVPMETGPLARLILSGNYAIKSSCMDRNRARVIETYKILNIMNNLINKVNIKKNNQGIYNFEGKFTGFGLTDTTRGALYHSIEIENSIIKDYNIITPTGWNLSPKSSNGLYGTTEKSLLGTKIKNVKNPIELGRIVRSYDPCVSCATHVLNKDYQPFDFKLV